MHAPTFSNYVGPVNKELRKFVSQNLNADANGWEAAFDSLVLDFINNSGKRLRPVLGIMAYAGMGGKDLDSMIKLSRAFELLHNSELIHDDIMDNSDTRRGRPSFHKAMQSWMENNGYSTDPKMDGVSMGILAGDYLIFMAIKSIMETNFSADAKVKMTKILCGTADRTIRGQIMDMELSRKHASEKEYMKLIELKTAIFFEDIIKMSAIAANADKKTEKNLMEFAKNLGYAFQIQDDVIGLFGDEKDTGKSTKSDIEEGKNTILVIKAREMGNLKIKQTVESILGKKGLTNSEFARIRKAIEDSGSLKYAKNLLDDYAARSIKLLNEIRGNIHQDTYSFLNNLMSFVVQRTF